MTRMKKKSSSLKASKPSVADAAWDAFFMESRVEDSEELRKQGWRSIYDLMEETKKTRNSVYSLLDSNPQFERKSFRVSHRGQVRELIFFRPKLKG